MDNHHGKPQDSMQESDNENEEANAPGLGLSVADMASVGLQPQGGKVGASEAAGTATGIAAKMAGVGKSTGSTFNTSNNVFN